MPMPARSDMNDGLNNAVRTMAMAIYESAHNRGPIVNAQAINVPLFAALRIFSVDKIRDTRAYGEKMENFQTMARKHCFGAMVSRCST